MRAGLIRESLLESLRRDATPPEWSYSCTFGGCCRHAVQRAEALCGWAIFLCPAHAAQPDLAVLAFMAERAARHGDAASALELHALAAELEGSR